MNIAYAASGTNLKISPKVDAWDLILHSGITVKFVLLTLLIFSVISWAIILTKKLQLTEMTQMNSKFLDFFWKAGSLDHIHEELGKFKASSLAGVFKAGYLELQKLAESQSGEKANSFSSGNLENITRALRKASEIGRAHV